MKTIKQLAHQYEQLTKTMAPSLALDIIHSGLSKQFLETRGKVALSTDIRWSVKLRGSN